MALLAHFGPLSPSPPLLLGNSARDARTSIGCGSSRFMEADRRVSQARRSDRSPVGARRRLAGASPRPPRARQRLCVPVGARCLATARGVTQRLPHATPVGTRPLTARRDRSIAVLPFINLSADPETEYFADGLTDEITADLCKVRSLRVTSRTSSATFKGSDQGCEDDRARARRAIPARGQRSSSGESASDHRTTHRRRRRHTSLGREVRRRRRRRVRDSGAHRPRDRGRARASPDHR